MNKLRAKNGKLPVIMHLLVWIVLIILPQIIISRYSGDNNFIAWGFYVFVLIIGVIFYINYLWLVPKFYMTNRKTVYFALALVVVISFYFVLDFSNKALHNPERDRKIEESVDRGPREPRNQRPPFKLMQIYGYSMLSVVIIGFSLGLKAIEQHSANEKHKKELEKEKLNSELAFLKNQVSPHFFFNTLNNIYSLIEINTNDAQEAVLKLSKLMRYLLYESERGETMLNHEVDFMKNYIDLMKLRLSNKVKLEVDLPENGTNIKVPPLLFIPFIENAFKHGISYREKSFISVGMKLENNSIKFSCENSIGQTAEKDTKDNYSGIGLENVKKRLALLFPGKHKLNIDSQEKTFHVNLEIELL